jgi:hypothetical protein
MDAFESVISMLLRREGYWTISSFKVKLTQNEKRQIGKHTTPRREIDLIAYHAPTNKVLAVECKSFLDSIGVMFKEGQFKPVTTYKLFVDSHLRRVVLKRLARQLEKENLCRPKPKVQLCLAAGKIQQKDHEALKAHFVKNNWQLFDRDWIREHLKKAVVTSYENDVIFVVAKLLLRDLVCQSCGTQIK